MKLPGSKEESKYVFTPSDLKPAGEGTSQVASVFLVGSRDQQGRYRASPVTVANGLQELRMAGAEIQIMSSTPGDGFVVIALLPGIGE